MGSEVVIVGGGNTLAEGLAALLEHNRASACLTESCADALRLVEQHGPALVIVDCPAGKPPEGEAAFRQLIDALAMRGTACMVLEAAGNARVEAPEWVQRVDDAVCAAELRGRIAAVHHCREVLRRASQELHHMQRLGRHLNRQFVEVDHDMRLAGRLQREFLPRSLPEVPGIRFAVLYRPASWVSGDIYDIASVDEDHVGLYLADAVGHGMAASLLTIFVKQAICTKEIENGSYRLVPPAEVLRALNDALASMDLQNSQYVTAAFGLLNHRDRTFSVARGGHPYPVVVDVDGSLREIRTEGGLLGLFPGQAFPATQVTLRPGQKLILYSDGMELAFVQTRDARTGEPRYHREFKEVAHLPADELIAELARRIDIEEGSLNPQDDVTVMVAEMAAS